MAAAPPSSHCQMVVASHSFLNPASQDMQSDLFGSPSARSNDGIHFRGKQGSKRHTSSVISALKSAGLGDWNTQGCPRDGSQQDGRTFSQAVRTSTYRTNYRIIPFLVTNVFSYEILASTMAIM